MFGSSTFGGFGQQNQAGANNAAPGTGMFGQAPAANTGAFGTPATSFGQTNTTPAFGTAQPTAFGSNMGTNQMSSFGFNQNNNTSSFGAPKPAGATGATGFGTFGAAGGMNTQSSTPAFGFGGAAQPQAQTGTAPTAFGASTGFGQQPAATTSFTFGQQQPAQPASAPTFGAFGASTSGPAAVTQGSATVPYAPFREDMTPNEPKAHAKTYEVHQSLTSMPAYQTMSPEELRWMDYQQGRSKGTAGPTPAGGASTSFGFGANNNTSAPSAFGQSQPPTTSFGQQPASTGLFGQQPNASTGMNSGQTSLFGNTGATTNTSTGLFGQGAAKPAFGAGTTTAPSTSMFGQSTSGGGMFGANTTQPNTTNTSSFMFGANNNNNNNNQAQQPSTGFGFGAANANQSKPGGLFGNAAGTSSSQPSTGFSFGSAAQPSTQTPFQSAGTSGFGASSNNTGSGFSFGAANNNQAKPAGGLFGAAPAQNNTASTQPSGFGAASTNTAAKPGFSFGGFGGNNTSQPAAGAQTGSGLGSTASTNTGGLFGAKPAGSTGFSFGASNNTGTSTGFGSNATQTSGSNSLFGAKPAGTSLFGSAPPAQNTAPSGTGSSGLFGSGATNNTNTTGGGLFGNNASKPSFSFGGGTSTNNNASTTGPTGASGTGGGLFGQSQPAPAMGGGGGLFGQSAPAAPSGGLFGAKPLDASSSAPNASASASMAAPPSLTTNPYGTDALLGQVGANAPASSQAPLPFNVAPKHKPPLTSPFRSSARNAVRVTRLRGSTPGLEMSRSVREGTPGERATTPGRAASVGLFRHPSDAAALSPQAFLPRSTSKRLVLDGDTSLTRSPSVWREGTPRASTAVPRFSPAAETVLGSRDKAQAEESSLSMSVPPLPSSVKTPAVAKTPASSTPPVPQKAPKSPRAPLQRGDYFIEPSLATLRSLAYEDLARVPDLVVGRVGIGRVAFLEPVDLTGVPDLGWIAGGVVQLRVKECFVYPQAEDLESDTPLDGLLPEYVPVPKAPLGTGLNVPARVSLEGCWPLDRATREPLKDESLPRVKQHRHKLQTKKDTEFVAYDAESGTWTFIVQHFSRYGLDSDDEDDEPMDDGDDNVDDDDDDGPPALRLGDESDSGSSAMRESELGSDDDAAAAPWAPAVREDATPFRRSMTPAQAARFTPGLAEPRKVQVMRASFFGQAPPTNGPVGGVSTGPALSSEASRALWQWDEPEAPTDAPMDAALDAPMEVPAANADADVDASVDASPAPPPAPAPSVRLTRVASAQSVLRGGPPTDVAQMLARSFRVGWGAPYRLVHNGTVQGDGPVTSWTKVRLESPACVARARPDAVSAACELLAWQLRDSEITTTHHVPSVSFRPGTTCHSLAQHYAADDKQYAAQLWHLASALFDPLDLGLPHDAPCALVNAATQHRRKMALSAWLERAVAADTQADTRAHVAASRRAEQVFALLSGHQIEHAADAALDAGMVRLATLLAQAGTAMEVRADLHDQLALWQSEGVDADIDTPIRRIYELLAGNVRTAQLPGPRKSDRQLLPMAAGLDWRRALGLHVWYGTPWEAPLRVSVESYEDAVRHAACETAPPLPPYQADAQLGALKQRALWQQPDAPRDALYELVQLFVDPAHPLAHVLEPRNYGADPLDYALPWHLYVYLTRALRARSLDDEQVGNRLTLSYAAQLEHGGAWRWAAFVLLHLTSTGVRARAVQALLARHVAHLGDADVREFLLDTLHIDPRWLASAQALAAHARGDYYGEFLARVEAHEWAAAHSVAVKHLACESFVRGDLSLLLDLFRPLARAVERGAMVPGWDDKGRVLLDYATVPALLSSLLAKAQDGSLSATERHAWHDAVARTHELIDRVPILFPSTKDLMSTVARTEMLATLHNVARLLASEAGAREPGARWTPATPPDAVQLQAAAQDFSAAMLACL